MSEETRPAAIDYILALPCEPKRRLGPDGLFERLRRLDRLSGYLSLEQEQEAQAREAIFQLRPLAFHCAHCPANHSGREFGCFGSVHTPLSAEAEEWLVGLLPVSLRLPQSGSRKIESARELIRRLQELEVDGKTMDERRRKDRMLERRRAGARKYGRFFGRTRITSSQLLQLLFLQGRVETSLAELVCRALGVWEDSSPGDDGVPEAVFTEPVEETDDPGVAELKQFLLASMVACSLDVPVQTRVDG